ncbi:hypothetical protein BDU57DRAFT_211131 [Ampelomyces quisqualis]|uniref:Rhodopsin domain-containing protein n=1 Tax=Ampelomyces quisqualis TaxID=50730 RepID=A0A6A5QN69_AMPQU|nr:hypothetical protein BDU57DRAFT_211131 [Ampelomyces quisqualis]
MPVQFVDIGGLHVDISQSDLSDTSSRVSRVRTANIVLISLVISIVSLRLFARIRFVKQIFVDDVLVVIAAAFTLALASTCIAATYSGLGTHLWLLPLDTILEDVKKCLLFLLVCQILYASAIALTKVAIISSYLRFIQNHNFRIIMFATLFVTISLMICGIVVPIFQCRPMSGAWSLTAQGICIDYIGYVYASSAVNVLTDIVLCALPIPHLWRLNLPLKQRIVLCVLFVGGTGACVAGTVRIAYLVNLRVVDFSYQSIPVLNLSVIECSIGIICVSVPPLRPMVAHVFSNSSRRTQTSSRWRPVNSRSIPLRNLAAHPTNAKLLPEHDYDNRSFKQSSSEERMPSV